MGSASIASLFTLLLLVLVLGGLVVGIVLIVIGGRKGPAGEMACGRCGYAVRGLQQLACPECGADLREAGIARGGSSGKRTLGIVLVSVCTVLLLSCCGLMAFSYLALSSTTVHSAPVQAVPAPQSTPSSQGQPNNDTGESPSDVDPVTGDQP